MPFRTVLLGLCGLYILAFPLRLAALHVWPDASRTEHFALSVILTLPLAMLSWHLLEQNVLRLWQPLLLQKMRRVATRAWGGVCA